MSTDPIRLLPYQQRWVEGLAATGDEQAKCYLMARERMSGVNDASPEDTEETMDIKTVMIIKPVIWTAADIEAASKGPNLVDIRARQLTEMLRRRERDIPGFTAHAPNLRETVVGRSPADMIMVGGE